MLFPDFKYRSPTPVKFSSENISMLPSAKISHDEVVDNTIGFESNKLNLLYVILLVAI